MSAKSEEYRLKAEQAEASAKTSIDLSAKQIYETVGRHYRFLAGQQDKMDGSAERGAIKHLSERD